MRVVSLVPSITETLLAWGVEPVAVTRFCEQPGLTTVGGTKNPDLDAIVALAPDLVVLDEEENREPDAAALVAAGVSVHVTAVRSLADVRPALAALAERVGVVVSLPSSAPAPPPHERLLAFVPIWRRPWMTINGDTYGASLLAALGVDTVGADASDRYSVVELAEVVAAGPAVSLVPTEPYSFGATHCAELERELRCPAHLVDGQDLFWWGARTDDALRRLAARVEEVRP